MRVMMTHSAVRLWITLLLLTVAAGALPAPAMVIMDEAAMDHAIRYGAKKAGRGYEELLGPNWRVGEEGTLLNIYTPYMSLAGKAYKAGLAPEPDAKQLKEARRKFAGELRYLKDPNDPKLVKFAVNLLGATASFPGGWHALVKGVGSGRSYEFKPSKVFRPQQAVKTSPGGALPYEAVLSFYFKQVDLLKLQDVYDLTFTDEETGRTVSFKLNNDKLF